MANPELCIFQRFEKKYCLTPQQRQQLMWHIAAHLTPDANGNSTISSLYLDTPDHLLIRNSIDARAYKEKLRLRSYGTPAADSRVFLELKKKYQHVVYKRRVSMTLRQAEAYLDAGVHPAESQILAEIDYAMRFYRHPRPAMLIAYEREAWFDRQDPALRLTFDTNVRYRDTDLDLSHGSYGTAILDPGLSLLEVKTGGAMPLYLSRALNECRIYPTSFSKYGTAYRRTQCPPTHHLKGAPRYA
jgi:hypothetical protein